MENLRGKKDVFGVLMLFVLENFSKRLELNPLLVLTTLFPNGLFNCCKHTHVLCLYSCYPDKIFMIPASQFRIIWCGI
jgi:hypothetical protein